MTIIEGEQTIAATVIAHDGNDGQINRTRGAFSFRVGDFFTGNDKEQMRLTEEGNLGVGTTKPKFKLDVAGAVRARAGFVFNDGSSLNVNDKGILTLTSADGNVVPNIAGSGTQGRLAKWTDNSGTLGDSVAIDTGTGLQLTAAPSGAVDTNLLYLNSTNGTTGVLAGSTPSYGANNGPFFAMRGNSYTTIGNQRGLFTIAAGNVANPQGDDGSVKFNTGNDQLRMVIRPSGNVGIGTPAPATKLDVNGSAFVRGSGTFANNVGAADFHIGYGLADPNTAGSVSRLAIQPYGHTGGPWKFVARDEPTKAYLDWVYGNSSTGITLEAQGNVGIGTATPAQKLTVTGIVQSTSGGFKFPDGSVLTSAGTTYTTYASTMGVLSGAPRSLLQLTSLPVDNYMVTVTLLARNLTAGNRTLSCGLTSDAQAPYHVDIANFAYTTLTLHGVSNVSSGSIAINCSVDQGDGITVYDRRLSATKLNNVVVQ